MTLYESTARTIMTALNLALSDEMNHRLSVPEFRNLQRVRNELTLHPDSPFLKELTNL